MTEATCVFAGGVARAAASTLLPGLAAPACCGIPPGEFNTSHAEKTYNIQLYVSAA